jgi:N-acetylneuraminate synthase
MDMMDEALRGVIAEIGSVHDGSFGNACKLIEAAAECGADAVKFQTHMAEAETMVDAPMPPYFQGEQRQEYFARTAFTPGQWQELASVCRGNGVVFLSSPFSLEAVDLGVEIYKIPSGEVSNLPMLEKIAALRKPVLLSSGMSSWAELDAAMDVLRNGGPVTIMQCSSCYPCPVECVGLNVIPEMARRYDTPVGFSDHTLGHAAAFAAAALGADVIEKHFTFSRRMYGSDAQHSMEPEDFRNLTAGLRDIWSMLGYPVDKDNLEPYQDMKRIFEKSVVTARALDAGTVLAPEDLVFKKPGDGISAARHAELIGRTIGEALPADHQIGWGDLK